MAKRRLDEPELKQIIDKDRMGDAELTQKPGHAPRRHADETPSPGKLRNDKQANPNRRPDAQETYRQGRQGSK
jgi:hypothetical protein